MAHARIAFGEPRFRSDTAGAPAWPGPRRLLGHAAMAAALSCMAATASAQTVTLNGQLGSQRALLVIDGQLVTLAVGATVHGVHLLSLGAGGAEVEVGGARRTLALGAGPVRLSASGAGDGRGAREIVLTASNGGHFLSHGQINGKAVSFLIDTGATTVAIGQAEAERIGLDYKHGPRGFASTANGRVPVQAVMLNSVRLGDVEIANVEAVVMPAAMDHVLLGNSFLSRFQLKRDNDVMRLEKR